MNFKELDWQKSETICKIEIITKVSESLQNGNKMSKPPIFQKQVIKSTPSILFRFSLTKSPQFSTFSS